MPASVPPEEIPHDQEGKSSLLHRLFVLTGRLGKITPAQLLPTWVALALIAAWPWGNRRVPAGGIFLLGFLWDRIALALLPVFRRSWGPVTPTLLGLTLVRTGLSWFPARLAPHDVGLALFGGLSLVLNATVTYATWVEPFRVEVTEAELRSPKYVARRPLRLLHLTDLHFEGPSPRERQVLEHVRALAPDLIVLTGDYLNLSSVYDPEAQAGARAFLAQLEAPLGVYAVPGSPVVDVPTIVPGIFQALPIRWLDDEVVRRAWAGSEIQLLGVRCTRDLERDARALRQLVKATSDKALSILLYHTPDLMPEAQRWEIDLYLAGHTHGGQLRVPFYGALFTSSHWGKRYEMGRYEAQGTTLYVSRGLGMEGLGAPRARFLAAPELVLWTLRGT
ncbi:MAG: metallophosphoesterase [Anaerolineae bacterium]